MVVAKPQVADGYLPIYLFKRDGGIVDDGLWVILKALIKQSFAG